MATDAHDVSLTEPAGIADPKSDRMITTRTTRRQQQLDQLTDPSDSPPGPLRGGEIDDRNDESYREAWALEHSMADEQGEPRADEAAA